MSKQDEALIEAAAEAVKLRDTICHAIMPPLDGKPMGVISAALTGICANFIAGSPSQARGPMRDLLFSQIDAMIPIAIEARKRTAT